MNDDEMRKAERAAMGFVSREDLTIGDSVTWLHETRGGYGYCENVHGKVLALGPKRATIEVERIVPNGEPRQFVKRCVAYTSLRRFESARPLPRSTP